MRHSGLAGAIAVSLLIALSGCVDVGAPQQVMPSSVPGSSAAARNPVREVVRVFGANSYTIAVRSLVSDGTNTELRVAVTAGANADGGTHDSLYLLWGDLVDPFSANRLRLVDFESSEVLLVGSLDKSYATNEIAQDWNEVNEVVVTAYFGASHSDRVSLIMPYLGVINDLEVEQSSNEFAPPEGMEALASYQFDRGVMQRFEAPYRGKSSVRIKEDEVTIAVPSEILFDFGSADLTSASAEATMAAVASIREHASGGKLMVVGHTDDQGDDSINEPLSQARAESVAATLRSQLGDGYAIDAEGRGSREPVVAGTTSEARSANRRVEIRFAATKPGATTSTSVELPETPIANGVGGEAVTIGIYEGLSFEVSVDRVERISGYLIGSIRSKLVSDHRHSAMTVFNPATREGRGYDFTGSLVGVGNVAILTQGARVFPIDYQYSQAAGIADDESDWQILGDRSLVIDFDPQTSMISTVIWPDLGTDTVTVEVAGAWRLTEVPVEASTEE